MKKSAVILEKENHFDPFAGPDIAYVVHTTQAQEEIWSACQLGGANANRAYNESVSLVLKGKLDRDALEKALQDHVERHESLRAVFSTCGRYMSVFERLNISLSFQDITDLSNTEREASVAAYLQKDANHIFDLVRGPLCKAGLLKVDDLKHRLIITAHHIICDGWSIGIFLQELGALYSIHVTGKSLDLPIPESFRAFADEQQALTESEAYDQIEQFWLRQYQESIPQLDLPTDFPRPTTRTYKSRRLDFSLDPVLLANLKKTGLQSSCSFITTLMAAFEIFLFEQSGQDELVVGLPAAGQSVSGMTQLIGHCANLLPLRSKINTDLSFVEYLKERKSALFDAYEYQQLSFGHLLQKLPIARDPSRVPLVPVVFNIDIGMTDGVAFSGLDYQLISNPRAYEAFEIFLNATGSEESLILEWSFNTDLFKPDTIKGMMNSFNEVLQKLIEAPTETLDSITNTDYTSAYEILNTTTTPYPDVALNELLAEQALATPHRTALKFGDMEFSYKSLQEKSNRLARYLGRQGVSQGDFVGVCLPRCPELLITLLAVMKCGAAYLPLDPSYPQARLEFMLEDSEAKFLMMTEELSTSLAVSTQQLVLEEAFKRLDQFSVKPLAADVSQDSIAYLLYTSGSTGKPKGVPISHGSLVNMLCSIAKEPGIHQNDRLLAITTISFDIAGVELFLPLLKGACVVMADTETARDGRLLLETLEKENITILQATPSTWQMLLNANWRQPMKLKAFCGGEALSPTLAKRLLTKCESLWNMYGPTEVTVYSIVKRVFPHDTVITIGKPIANTQVYILDEQGHLAMPGTMGEIVIAGDGVADGYWKRPDLTAEKFVENHFDRNGNSILYRSGDLGRLLATGEIECLGRLDQQVKIRGHRIEPGEVEQALIELDAVQSAVVLAQSDRLVAYVVPNDIPQNHTKRTNLWRKILEDRLPAYLVPQEFRILKALPTTPNGKLDRKALLENETIENADRKPHTLPRSKTETLVANIWKECLALEDVDIYSNFFELGGHSLLAMQVMVRIEEQTSQRLPLAALFEYSTVEKLAALLDSKSDAICGDSLVPIQTNGNKPPLFLIHGVGLNTLKFNDLVKNLDDDQPVYGLQGIGINSIDERSITVEEIAAHYVATITKAYPEGPYALAGHSFGGIISYEMTRQLREQGKKVSMLAMLDSYVEPYFYYSSSFGKVIGKLHYHLRKKLNFLNVMFSSRENFKSLLNRKLKSIFGRSSEGLSDTSEVKQLEFQRMTEVERMNYEIMKRYHLVPELFEIDLFRAEKPLFFMHDPEYLGWKNIALKRLHVYDVPGDHLDMFAPPNDVIFAKILQGVLDYRNEKNK